jgi:hypothetical protein
MQRKAWIEAHQFDLEAIAEHFKSGDTRIVQEGDEYYLTSPEIDAAADDPQANGVVAKIIRRINSLGRIHDANFQPVKLKRYTNETGQTVVTGVMAAMVSTVRLRATATVTKSGTVIPNPPSPWPGYLALADTNSDVAEALEIITGNDQLGWVELFKIREIICRSVEPTTIVKLGWTTADRDSTFTSSANNPAISGSDARHARPPKGSQPKRKMSISEGQQYVRDLVTKWLDHLT